MTRIRTATLAVALLAALASSGCGLLDADRDGGKRGAGSPTGNASPSVTAKGYKPAGNLCFVDLTALNPIAAKERRDLRDKPSSQTDPRFEYRVCILQRWWRDESGRSDRWYSMRVEAAYFPGTAKASDIDTYLDQAIADERGKLSGGADGPPVSGVGERAHQLTGKSRPFEDPANSILLRNENLVLEVHLSVRAYGLRGEPAPTFTGDVAALLQAMAKANLTKIRELGEGKL